MADVRPFAGVRFDPSRAGLARVVCPPYDVIGPELARKLRRRPENSIHLELPEGEGPAKYRNAARLWRRWRQSGLLRADGEPAFYVCEERFRLEGRPLRRRGFLAALGVTPGAAKRVLPHERTLPKPKADRLRLLSAVRANISPIFGIFADAGAVRGVLRRTASRPCEASGKAPGVSYRVWRMTDGRDIALVRRALASKTILIADGHHRCEVGRAYHARTRAPGAETVLAYLCPEEDGGLVVLPTHRVVSQRGLVEQARGSCRVSRCPSLDALMGRLSRSRNPYAFGLFEGGFHLAEPRDALGCRSGLCVEWVGRHLLGGVAPDRIGYTHEAREALALARGRKGAAIFVKPMRVSQIRRAVRAVGLLPPKSTYFYPKIATGLVFKPV